jgi:BRCT domain type II-containing protein
VGKTTDYVVVGEDPGAKLTTASRLGVPTLDEAALRTLLAAADDPAQAEEGRSRPREVGPS